MLFAFSSAPTYEVVRTAELRRIVEMPRRAWAEEEARDMAAQLTELLRTPSGAVSLRPVQAIALAEIGMRGGLFGIMRVGSGKTLTSLLAPGVAQAKRPMLLIPAKLIGKTERDCRALREHWDIPEPIIISYEKLGRAQAAEALDEYAPDLIGADEAHKLKNVKAAVTRRVRRYMREHPATKFVAMSGTVAKRSLYDYAHMLRWALKTDVPLPDDYNDLMTWADALDERKNMLRRAEPGSLYDLCNDEERAEWGPRDTDRRTSMFLTAPVTRARVAARNAYRRRLIETEGVIATSESGIDASLLITAVTPPASTEIDAAFDHLRKTWETPDGEPISDAPSMYRHAREIALGFYYRWNPRPPRDWLDARRTWCAFVRQTLARSRSLDSELQVKHANPTARELTDWLAVKNKFEPNTELVWIDNTVLDYAADWLALNTGILWVEHVKFARALAQLSGATYYGAGNASDAGKHARNKSMILSIEAGREGLNLQPWSSNFVVSPPSDGERWEQLLGRTHRDGQGADEVAVEVAAFCIDHVHSYWQARDGARYVADSLGSPQKLLLADQDFPTVDDLAGRRGGRWNK